MTSTPIKAIPYHIAWDHVDIGRVREEFAYIADRGLTHIVLSPAWYRLQPRPQQLDRAVMAVLEQCYDAAGQVGLKAMTTLLTAGYAGERELPDWHHTADVVGWLQGRTTAPLYGGGGSVRINGVRRQMSLAHPYTTDEYRTGQHALIRGVMGYFAGHPAARHWVLAPGWSYLADVDPIVAQKWWQSLVHMARRVHADAVLIAHIDGPQLLGHGLDAVMVGRDADYVWVDTAMPVLAQRQHRHVFAPMYFLQYVVAGLTQRPTLIGMHPIGVGAVSSWQRVRWYDRSLAVPILGNGQSSEVWHAFVRFLQQTTTAGLVYPFGWHAGYDSDRREYTAFFPHMRPDLLHEYEQVLRAWQHIGVQHESFDGERFLYRPQLELQRLWHEYTMNA